MTDTDIEKVIYKLQRICPHTFGRIGGTNRSRAGLCSYCFWDLDKCQHKKADSLDKFCKECGEEL